MKRKPRIFITGATGFIGSHFVEIAKKNYKLHGLSRHCSNSLRGGVTWVQGDVLRPKSWKAKLKGCDAVVHLATCQLLDCESNPDLGRKVILDGARHVLDACIQMKVPRLVIASTAEVYGIPEKLPMTETTPLRPASIYGSLKAVADLHFLSKSDHKQTGPSVCVLRFFNVYGRTAQGELPKNVFYHFANALSQNRPITLHGSHQNSRDFIHVKDVAFSLVQAVERGAEGVVNIGSGKETRLANLAKKMAKMMKKTLIIDLRENEGRVRRARSSTGVARRLLKFKPKVSLEQGLREVLDR